MVYIKVCSLCCAILCIWTNIYCDDIYDCSILQNKFTTLKIPFGNLFFFSLPPHPQTLNPWELLIFLLDGFAFSRIYRPGLSYVSFSGWCLSFINMHYVCCAYSLSCVWLFVTPWTVARQAYLTMGMLQARILEWVAMSSFRESSQPKDPTQASRMAAGFFTIWITRETQSSSTESSPTLWSESCSVVSDSLGHHGLYSPGQNTGVGSLSFLQGSSRPRNWTKVSCIQFSSVTQSCLTLCNPMNPSTPCLPVHHQLLDFTQTHVHWVGNAIQPSHPLSSPSPPALNLS